MSWLKSPKAISIYKAGGYSVASVVIGALVLPLLSVALEQNVSWAFVIPVVNVVLVAVKKFIDMKRGL